MDAGPWIVVAVIVIFALVAFALSRSRRGKTVDQTVAGQPTAAMTVSFQWLGPKGGIAEVRARNEGPAGATDVSLDVWAVLGGARVEVERSPDKADEPKADVLNRGESVMVRLVFGQAPPRPEDLSYRLEFNDGRGERQRLEDRVPILWLT